MAFFLFGRKTKRRKSSMRKPSKSLLKQCRKYRIKTTIKRGRKRVYKKVSVLKKQLRKKKKLLKKRKKTVRRSHRRRRNNFGAIDKGKIKEVVKGAIQKVITPDFVTEIFTTMFMNVEINKIANSEYRNDFIKNKLPGIKDDIISTIQDKILDALKEQLKTLKDEKGNPIKIDDPSDLKDAMCGALSEKLIGYIIKPINEKVKNKTVQGVIKGFIKPVIREISNNSCKQLVDKILPK